MTESSGLPPEQEAVRRLLADARHDGPPPPEVVARLDDTLASLVAERAATDTGDSPGRLVDLGSRRRRVASIGLLAAASVVVAGVALGQALPRGASDSESSAESSAESGAGSAADSSLAESPPADTESGGGSSDSGAGAAENAPESLRSSPATPFAGLPSLSSTDAGLADRVLALRAGASPRHRALGPLGDASGCDVPRVRARQLAVEVDGQPGLLVFRRPTGGVQTAQLYACGDPDPVRTLTLPAP